MVQYIKNIPVWGEPMEEAVAQMEAALSYGGDRAALMADHHLGYSIPIGGVIAYKSQICPNGVGYDIACGNKGVKLDCDADKIKRTIDKTMDLIWREIAFGTGGTNRSPIDHPLFEDPLWRQIPLLKGLEEKARVQLGSVGSGNHYVDLLVDEENRLWVGVHFGSRGFGHAICTHFIKAAGGKDGIHAKPVILDEDSDLGEQYLKCMKLAGRYAYAGRDWVCKRVAELLDAEIVEEVHNHHNFAWREKHDGIDYWVVRKGATPAFPGQKGFVGGSMGDISVILEGVDSEESKQALYSTIHGAGRVLGRRQALRQIKHKEMMKWLESKGVVLRGGGVDESPHVYKRIEDVLKAHRNTIRVLHTLQPIGVAMAAG